MGSTFDTVRHYLAVAEEATESREAFDAETISEQAKYIKWLEEDSLKMETAINRIDKIVSNVPQAGDADSAVMDIMRIVCEHEAKCGHE